MTKPLLRWAGGKRWLTSSIRTLLPSKVESYFEPFCGSCSVFFSIADLLEGRPSFLSDLNADLIEFYRVLQSNPKELLGFLDTYENSESFYYTIRAHIPRDRIEAAAKFFYLNRTSFNGIYRVNLKGEYNVPFGFKKYAKFIDHDHVYMASNQIRQVSFHHADFSWILKMVAKDSLVFADPPYTVSHNLNGFIKYNQKLFSIEDQHRLKSVLDACSEIGANYLLTNAHHEAVHDIFASNANETQVDRYTSIAGSNSGRKYTSEFIFTNYEVSK